MKTTRARWLAALTAVLFTGCGAAQTSIVESATAREIDRECESDTAPVTGVTRTRVSDPAGELIEVQTASVSLRLPAPSPPDTCAARSLLAVDLPLAHGVSVAVSGARALVAVEGDGWHTLTWDVDLASGAVRDASFPNEVRPRAFVLRDDLVLSTWAQGGGVRFHSLGSHPAPPDSTVDGLGIPLGSVEGPDGSLWLWHHRAMSEAGDPIATLTRIYPDGHRESTTGETNGAILGVVPDDTGVFVWRTPLLGHHGDATTVQRLEPALVLERDVAVRERVSAAACPFFLVTRHAEGLLVCGSGDTWSLSSTNVLPGLAFGHDVLAVAGTDVATAARVDRDSHELRVETFGGPLARFPLHGDEVLGAGLGVDGSHVVVAWLEAASRDATERHLEVHALDCAH